LAASMSCAILRAGSRWGPSMKHRARAGTS
jgi:hypothetical protein